MDVRRQLAHSLGTVISREGVMHVLDSVVDVLPGLVWTADSDGYVDFVNARWCEYTGLCAERAFGHGWQMSVHRSDLPQLVEDLEATRISGIPHDVEARLQRFDGAYRWFLTRVVPLADSLGRIAGWCGLSTEVEGSLASTRSHAQVASVTSLETLTASIAHEVNQPLSGIITNASTCLRMLAAEPPDVEGARETARRTIRDGHRASDVITRLRALFTNQQPAPGWVDLNEAIREVIVLSGAELQQSQTILRTALDDDLPLVAGDRVQLQQVILNLLRNAFDAVASVDDRPRHVAICTERDEEGGVRLTVRDAGIGMPLDDPEQLFDPFYTTKIHGMGIGLSVSRYIIESHHGRLWARPNEGAGMTFTFWIPGGLVSVPVPENSRTALAPIRRRAVADARVFTPK